MGQSCTKNFTVASIGLKPSNQRYGSQPNDSLNPYYPQTINYELAIIRQSQIKNYYLNTNYHKELVLRLSYEELAFLMVSKTPDILIFLSFIYMYSSLNILIRKFFNGSPKKFVNK